MLAQAVWILKCRALTLRDWVDDTDTVEEEGVGDILLDDNAVASVPRPGTSLSKTKASGQIGSAIQPVDISGRPTTGYVRPGTASRPMTGGLTNRDVQTAFKGKRPGTSRPATALGRQVRLGTASLASGSSDVFVDVDKLDMRRYAQRPALGKVLCDYLLYHDQNPRKALELCAKSTKSSEYKDWWWKARLGKCYYRLGLYNEAVPQFASSLRQRHMMSTALELSKTYAYKMDQPNTALGVLRDALILHPCDVDLMTNAARIHALLNTTVDAETDAEDSVASASSSRKSKELESARLYRQVLRQDPTSVEAMSCLASHYFYSDRPEIALRFYRRLIQMGLNTVEVWNNVGLCCFYSSQYDMAVSCFEKAMALATDENVADVWYNIGQVAIGIGDLDLAYRSFKICAAVDPNHAEAINNIGVLDLRKGEASQARSNFERSQSLAPHVYEPFFNGALLAFKVGDFQESFDRLEKSLHAYPSHDESATLMKKLKRQLRKI